MEQSEIDSRRMNHYIMMKKTFGFERCYSILYPSILVTAAAVPGTGCAPGHTGTA